MSVVTREVKRLIIGSPVRSDRVGHSLLLKRLALPIFASDALSSVAYATQEILLVTSVPWHMASSQPRVESEAQAGEPVRSPVGMVQRAGASRDG